MSIKMVCLGRHWNAKTYTYEATRSDYDGLPVQELPEDLKQLARRAAREAGMQIEPDICLINCYPESRRLGVHQDKDERPETIQAGIPVVSVSIGDAAKFLIGGTRRKDLVKTIVLESGDAIVMGGPSRLRYHGVSGILSDTAPRELNIQGRFDCSNWLKKTIDVETHKSKMLLTLAPYLCGMFLHWTVRPHLNRRSWFSALP